MLSFAFDTSVGGFVQAAAMPKAVSVSVTAIAAAGASSADTGAASNQPKPAAKREHEPLGAETAEESRPEPAPQERPSDHYEFRMRQIEGMSTPLIQLYDTESDRTILSYPPEQRVRMLEGANLLGRASEDCSEATHVDATA